MTTATTTPEVTASEIMRTTIREAMAQTGRTLDDAANALGPKVARALDSGRFDVHQLARVAEWLGVDPYTLMGRPSRLPECPPWCWADHTSGEWVEEAPHGPLHRAPRVTFAQGRHSLAVDVFWQPGGGDERHTEPVVDVQALWDGSPGDGAPASLWSDAARYVEGLLGEAAR